MKTKAWIRFIFILIGLIFFYHLWASRHAPSSASARVQAYVVQMASRVIGQVTDVYVQDNQVVKKGDPLIQLDPLGYQYAVEQAQAAYTQAAQKVAGLQAAVHAAEAVVASQQARVNQAQHHADEYLPLVKKGVVPRAQGYDVIAELKTAQADLSKAVYELQNATEAVGGANRQNSILAVARANLQHAQLALDLTKIVAPADGYVTNLQLHVGDYAHVGDPLLSFVANRYWWVTANFKETNIELIKPGERADVSVDMYPGKIFHGTVQSMGWGIRVDNIAPNPYLPYNDPTTTWIKLAQLFPVIIAVDVDPNYPLRVGATAHVTIYTGWNLFNFIPYLIRVVQSFLNYLY